MNKRKLFSGLLWVVWSGFALTVVFGVAAAGLLVAPEFIMTALNLMILAVFGYMGYLWSNYLRLGCGGFILLPVILPAFVYAELALAYFVWVLGFNGQATFWAGAGSLSLVVLVELIAFALVYSLMVIVRAAIHRDGVRTKDIRQTSRKAG